MALSVTEHRSRTVAYNQPCYRGSAIGLAGPLLATVLVAYLGLQLLVEALIPIPAFAGMAVTRAWRSIDASLALLEPRRGNF